MNTLLSPFVVMAAISGLIAIRKFPRDRFLEKKFAHVLNTLDRVALSIACMIAGLVRTVLYGAGVAVAVLLLAGTQEVYLIVAASIGYLGSWTIRTLQMVYQNTKLAKNSSPPSSYEG